MTSLFGENTIAKQELNGIEIHLGPRGVDITDRYVQWFFLGAFTSNGHVQRTPFLRVTDIHEIHPM